MVWFTRKHWYNSTWHNVQNRKDECQSVKSRPCRTRIVLIRCTYMTTVVRHIIAEVPLQCINNMANLFHLRFFFLYSVYWKGILGQSIKAKGGRRVNEGTKTTVSPKGRKRDQLSYLQTNQVCRLAMVLNSDSVVCIGGTNNLYRTKVDKAILNNAPPPSRHRPQYTPTLHRGSRSAWCPG